MTGVGDAIEADDRLALLELEGDYARRFDTRDGSGWANLFTEDSRCGDQVDIALPGPAAAR